MENLLIGICLSTAIIFNHQCAARCTQMQLHILKLIASPAMKSLTNFHKQNNRGPLQWNDCKYCDCSEGLLLDLEHRQCASCFLLILLPELVYSEPVLNYFIGRSRAVVAHQIRANDEIAPCNPKACVTSMDWCTMPGTMKTTIKMFRPSPVGSHLW